MGIGNRDRSVGGRQHHHGDATDGPRAASGSRAKRVVAGLISTPDGALLPLLGAVVMALLGGYVLRLSFPQPGWWMCAPIGVALILAAFRGRSLIGTILTAFVAGETFYLALIHWSTLFLGPVPWLGLATLETLIFVGGAVLLHLFQRRWPWPGRLGRLMFPWVCAGIWLVRERIANEWPYSGFAWGRVGQSQSDGWFSSAISWLGLDGMTFVLVAAAASIVEMVAHVVSRRHRDGMALGVVALGCLTLLVLLPVYRLPNTGVALVGAAQGGTEAAGYFVGGTAADVRDAHIVASNDIAQQLQGRTPIFVVWPEGSFLPDPAKHSVNGAIVRRLSEKLRAPLLVGTVHYESEQTIFNQAQVWTEAGLQGAFNKRQPIPFGEYVPDRKIWRIFAPKEIDMVQREYQAGTSSPVLTMSGIRVGVGICFDVVIDALAQESVQQDAQMLVYPTNNADFGQTDELAQQLAFSRLRALETGRSVLQASTVGYTAAFAPDGTQIAALPWYEAKGLVVEVPLVTGKTPAYYVQEWLATLVAITIATLGASIIVLNIKQKRSRSATIPENPENA